VRLLQSLARRALVLRASLRRREWEQCPRILEGKRKTLVVLEAPRERVEGAVEIALRTAGISIAANDVTWTVVRRWVPGKRAPAGCS